MGKLTGVAAFTLAALFCLSATAHAATPQPPRIGFVAGAGGCEDMAVTNRAFFDALAQANYRRGTTLDVVCRTAEGNMALMPNLVREVLAQDVQIFVVSSSPGCAAAKVATSTVPVLCISVQDDPVQAGLTETTDKGTGNIIGVHSYLADGIAQEFGLLDQLVPGVRTVGVLFNPQNATHRKQLAEWEATARQHSAEIVPMPITSAGDIGSAMDAAIAQKAQIGIGLLGADTYALRKDIADAAAAHRFPMTMDTPGGYTQLGGLATIGVDIVPLYRRGALELMVPLLQGKRPPDLAWIGPSRVDMTVNGQVAEGLGIKPPTH